MAMEPENLVLNLLRDIRGKQDEHTTRLDALDSRIRHVESQLDDLHATVTYSLGLSAETKFKQAKQEARIDELFAQVEKLLGEEKPL
jgi:polyhydroxyalkanoate synthesis regulator phasin